MKTLIAEDWVNHGIDNIPKEIKKKANAIFFYSSLNSPKELAYLFGQYKDFKNVQYIDMEDIDGDSIILHQFSCQVPNPKGIDEIIDFVNINNKSEDEIFIASCAVGISRTGALVEYILSKGYQLKTTQSYGKALHEFSPNPLILKLFYSEDHEFSKHYYNIMREKDRYEKKGDL